MKTTKYVPTICQGENAKFEGHVELKKITFDEKLELWGDYDDEEEIIGDDGQVVIKKKSANKKNCHLLASIIRFMKRKYAVIDIRNKETGKEYKTYDDLEDDSETQSILTDVATAIINGFDHKVGNG